MSNVFSPYTIALALKEAEKLIGSNGSWFSVGHREKREKQEKFLEMLRICGKEDVKEIKSIATQDTIRWGRWGEFLRRMYSPYRYPDSPRCIPLNTMRIAIASILDISVKLVQKSEDTHIKTKGGEFIGVRVPDSGVNFLKVPGHRYPVAKLKTSSDDRMYITPIDQLDQPLEDFELLAQVEKLSRPALKPMYEFGGLVFPLIYTGQIKEITWLDDIYTISNDGIKIAVDQTLQKIKFEIDEKGTMPYWQLSSKSDFVVDRPFLLWLVRPTLNMPLLVVNCTERYWFKQ